MAFLFQDQNQGIRNDAPRGMRLSRPFSFIRTLTVGFGIAPNLLTLFPKQTGRRRSRAWVLSTLTAGGEFHPALRTSAVRYGRPKRNYGQWPGRQQAPSSWGISMPPCPHRETQADSALRKLAIEAAFRRAGGQFGPADQRAANLIPVCS